MTGTSNQVSRQTFKKLERLVSRKVIEQLMAEGKNLHMSPFRLVWLPKKLLSPYPLQVAFSVPKRNFRMAVQRNRIKRLMREVYRKNKSTLYALLKARNEQYAMLLVYTGFLITHIE